MRKKVFFIALIASTFTTQTQAANNNPATVEYVQSQMTSIINYVKSQLTNIPAVTTYTLGQHAMGGIVFYVDSTGTHGLVAASNENGIASGQTWDGGLTTAGTDIIVNATGDGIGAGAMNTSLMVGVQSGYAAYLSHAAPDPQYPTLSDMAAQFCVNYSAQADGSVCQSNTSGASCIGNWYLPSLYELNQMFLQKSALGYPMLNQDAFIWSSTEYNQSEAWRVNFSLTTNQKSPTAKSDSCGVWCIHAF